MVRKVLLTLIVWSSAFAWTQGRTIFSCKKEGFSHGSVLGIIFLLFPTSCFSRYQHHNARCLDLFNTISTKTSDPASVTEIDCLEAGVSGNLQEVSFLFEQFQNLEELYVCTVLSSSSSTHQNNIPAA